MHTTKRNLPRVLLTDPDGSILNVDANLEEIDVLNDSGLLSLPPIPEPVNFGATHALFGHGPLGSARSPYSGFFSPPADSSVWPKSEQLAPDLGHLSIPSNNTSSLHSDADNVGHYTESILLDNISFDREIIADVFNSSYTHFPVVSGNQLQLRPFLTYSYLSTNDGLITSDRPPHSSGSSLTLDAELTRPPSSYDTESLRLHTDFSGVERSPPIASPKRWSPYSSPTSSVPESPSVYSPFRAGLPFPDYVYDAGFPGSPGSASIGGIDIASASSSQLSVLRSPEIDGGGGYSSAATLGRGRGWQRPSYVDGRWPRRGFSRSSSASSSVHIPSDWECSSAEMGLGPSVPGVSVNSASLVPFSLASLTPPLNEDGVVARQRSGRRAFSGPRETNIHSVNAAILPGTRTLSRRGRVSDSYLTGLNALPSGHDSGMPLDSSLEREKMWFLAQDTPTFEDSFEDDEYDSYEPPPPVPAATDTAPVPSPAPSPSSALILPREKVASDALVQSTSGRRQKEATFFCDVSGCKASFTAKHNLQNHVNSHFRIRDFKCARCERDFGTAHVLQRHRKVCKGKKKLPC
jgi:hypothetical protein